MVGGRDIQRVIALRGTPTGRRTTREVARVLDALDARPDDDRTGRPLTPDRAAELVHEFQRRAGLPETGSADGPTVVRLIAELEHRHVAASSMRTHRLQESLTKTGFAPSDDEVARRRVGNSTTEVLTRFQESQGLEATGLATDETISRLRDTELTVTLSTKRQTARLQKTLLRAARAKGIELAIDGAEMRAREQGPSTRAAVEALQRALLLPITGSIDVASWQAITSTAASRRPATAAVKAPDPAALTPVPRTLRLNATSKDVPTLQRALAFAGHAPARSELLDSTFGASTRRSVIAFQAANGLPQTGAADARTVRTLNAVLADATAGTSTTHRIRGSVRDASWVGRADVTVELSTSPVTGAGTVIGARLTLANGFYDLPYEVPRDQLTGRPVSPLLLKVRFVDGAGTEIGVKDLRNPPPIAWANYTEGDFPYRGQSLWETQAGLLARAGVADVGALAETAADPAISRAAQAAGLSQDDVMRLVLSARVADLMQGDVDELVCFAFLAQSLPASVPDDLLAQTHEWTLIDQLVGLVATGIAFTDPELAAPTIDAALGQNLVPISIAARRPQVLADLAAVRTRFALDQPLLVGNGNLRGVLTRSDVPAPSYDAVAEAFVRTGGLGPRFWEELREDPQVAGGPAAVASLEVAVDLGLVAKNFAPMLTLLEARIADPAHPEIGSSRDLAKLDATQWEQLVLDGGGAVPADSDGDTLAEQQATYARTLASQAERLFPTVALASAVARSATTGLTRQQEIAQVIDDNPDLELRQSNLDAYIDRKNLSIDTTARSELRVLQRVSRLAPTARTGVALLENGVHSAVQVVSIGRETLVRRLGASGVDAVTTRSIYGYAEHQYAQVLQRLGEFRAELQIGTPAALAPQLMTADERAELLNQIPDLETLFGPLDACDCPHCASVYGPAAYLADVLRFLDSHPAQTGNRSVRAVLAERRPEVGTVKLDCANTETALPYIDLVNETLEAEAAGAGGHHDLQTTWTATELRAAPEHQDDDVYDVLRNSDVPMSSGFDLWEEQTRLFLDHLGSPRWRLMRLPDPTEDPAVSADTAAEYFGISSHEAGLITTARAGQGDQDQVWDLDTSQSTVPVLDLMGRAGLGYPELLLLLQTAWITPPGDPRVVLERPAHSADLRRQRLTHVTPAVLDRVHRLVRLRHHTPWDFWELDLLLGAARIGAGDLDGDALAALQAAAELGARLGVGPEQLAAWFGQFGDAGRPSAADPSDLSAAARPLFDSVFAADPNDDATIAFAAAGMGGSLSGHRAHLTACLGISDAALTAQFEHTGTTKDRPTLSRLYGWSELARRARIEPVDLLTAADLLTPVLPDAFASPGDLDTLLNLRDEITRSGLSLTETDYLLHARPDSPLAPGVVGVADALTSLRERIRSSPAVMPAGQVIEALTAATRLAPQVLSDVLGLSDAQGTLASAFTDPAFTERTPAGAYVNPDITPVAFPRLFDTYIRLLKISRVLDVLALDDTGTSWLIEHADTLGLPLADLPVGAEPADPLLPGWLAIVRWASARRSATLRPIAAGALPVPASVVDSLVEAAGGGAPTAALRTLAAAATGVDEVTLTKIDGDTSAAYADPAYVNRLLEVSTSARRLGVAPAAVVAWARREQNSGPTEREIAAQVRGAARAKYDHAAWLAVLTPIQDTMRERKRDALVGFLLERSSRTEPESVQVNGQAFANPRRWNSADDLLAYFLVDVEMSSCQLTSRIKQLMGSTQMFVQRALMNLEKPHVVISQDEAVESTSPNSWRQWRWMKSYRIWEANRKIFLYPENWLEPELRDNKTPFFTELEQEVLQGDITSENCETALRHYLEKVVEVGNLEVVGMHHEIDDDHPWDGLPPAINVVHVVGRTRGEPYRYYYRTFDLNTAEWAPWELIELDITGEQVLPVVHDRVLHLFWLRVEEKAQKISRQPPAQGNPETQQAPETPVQMQLKLCWTQRLGDGWSTKQVSPHTLVHPWRRAADAYTIKPRYHAAENRTWIDVYVSMSQEFNNSKFWDPFSGQHAFLSGRRFDETARPWHSSSFVFDGHVSEIRLKPLRGQYHVIDASGSLSGATQNSDSFQYVRALSDPQRRVMKTLTGPGQISARIALPDGMHLESGRLRPNTWVANNGAVNVLQGGASAPLLGAASLPYSLSYSLHRIQFDTAAERSPFIYTDSYRSFFVTSQWASVVIDSSTTVQRLGYTFLPFHHPFARVFLRELNRSGVDGVLNRAIQRFPESYRPGNAFDFSSFAPRALVSADPTAQRDTLDFSRSGAMSVYNWEIFFHVPFLIAGKLATNQRFDESLDWYHRIFDPTNTEALSVPQRFWITKPFFDENDENYRRQRIESILADAELDPARNEIRAWRNNPFVPDVIARFRPLAYQKAVVMKYLDALIAWGDQLFRRETLESLNEATLLYVLASELLGRRPEKVPAVPRPGKSYDELVAESQLDPFGNQRVEVQLENFTARPTVVIASDEDGALPVVDLQYFGIPANDQMLDYWDLVADRLRKLRNCMNISGVVRQLPLFEPPIDPALLVRATAAGLDLSTVLDDVPAGGSPYRFPTLLATAGAFVTEVRQLGERMLAALEKRDAEALAALHTLHDSDVQSLLQRVREDQVLEAQRSLAALEGNAGAIQARIDYYSSIPYMNPWEIGATVAHGAGVISQVVATVLNSVAGGASLAPSTTFGAAGFGGSPVATVTYGGANVAESSVNFGRLFEGVTSVLHSVGSMLEAQGSYRRQYDNNQHQADLARKELGQLSLQVLAAAAREQIAGSELAAQQREAENARAVSDFVHEKYTGTDFFEWLISQTATVYFQAYQLAFDMARRAEAAYRFELGDQTLPPIVQFGYWDSLKRGLLAGDRLSNDLHRLEVTYLERHRRRLQATTHVSLATLMPDKLLELTTRGSTTFDLAEWVFARENPGWINQRITSVAVTMPCTSGPYGGAHATVSLVDAVVRLSSSTANGFGDALGGNDPRFAKVLGPVTSIRTSHGENDRGGPLSVRVDDRYDAFEGAGLISRWTLTMDRRDNAFDLSSLSDVVLSIDYEGDQGTNELVDLARDAVVDALPTSGVRLFSLDSAFAGQWHLFHHPVGGTDQDLRIPISIDDLPFLHRQAARSKRLVALRADLVLQSKDEDSVDVRIQAPSVPRRDTTTAAADSFGGLQRAVATWQDGAADLVGDWHLQVKKPQDNDWRSLPPDLLEHGWLLVTFATA